VTGKGGVKGGSYGRGGKVDGETAKEREKS